MGKPWLDLHVASLVFNAHTISHHLCFGHFLALAALFLLHIGSAMVVLVKLPIQLPYFSMISQNKNGAYNIT
jgi:hypothetical protein